MGIPEEDKAPVWLRDWGSESGTAKYDSRMGWFSSTAMVANPQSMLELANSLEQEHLKDFVEHAKEVITKLEYVHGMSMYTELDEALTHQSRLAYTSTDLFREHDYAVTKFVAFVKEMAEKYRTADADSSIRLSDVNSELYAPIDTGNQSTTTTASPNLGASPTTDTAPATPPTTVEY